MGSFSLYVWALIAAPPSPTFAPVGMTAIEGSTSLDRGALHSLLDTDDEATRQNGFMSCYFPHFDADRMILPDPAMSATSYFRLSELGFIRQNFGFPAGGKRNRQRGARASEDALPGCLPPDRAVTWGVSIRLTSSDGVSSRGDISLIAGEGADSVARFWCGHLDLTNSASSSAFSALAMVLGARAAVVGRVSFPG